MHETIMVHIVRTYISIVIANYNYGRFLEDAIKSVVEQDGFDKCELIVVDGGSTDNSVEIIKKYANGLPPNTLRSEWDKDLATDDQRLTTKISWWCSEKDGGQSDAFNKGFAHARGRLGCWVNADDLLLPGTLKAVLDLLASHPNCEWITGGMVFFDADEKIMWMRLGMQPLSFMWKWMPGWCIGGPSSFFSLEKLRMVGGFDVGRYYSMDVDLWYKLFQCGLHPHHIKRYFWGFRAHEASKTAHTLKTAMSRDMLREKLKLFETYGLSIWKIRIGSVILRLSGCLGLLRSYWDSWRYSKRSLQSLMK